MLVTIAAPTVAQHFFPLWMSKPLKKERVASCRWAEHASGVLHEILASLFQGSYNQTIAVLIAHL